MNMIDSIKKKLITARKEKNKNEIEAYSLLIGEIQRSPDKDYSDKNVISILRKVLKLSKESKNEYLIFIIEDLLPSQVSESDIKSFVEKIDFSKFKNPKQSFGLIKKNFDGNVDMAMVSKIVEDFLK